MDSDDVISIMKLSNLVLIIKKAQNTINYHESFISLCIEYLFKSKETILKKCMMDTSTEYNRSTIQLQEKEGSGK